MAELNLNDLNFILQQIEISEAIAAYVPPPGTPEEQAAAKLAFIQSLIPQPHLPWGLRTVDGTYNNIIAGRETWGAADQDFMRLLEAKYRTAETGDPDGPTGPSGVVATSYAQTTGTVLDSQPRTISNLIVDQTLNNPAAIMAALDYAGITGAAATAARNTIISQHTAVAPLRTAATAAAAAEAAALTALGLANAELATAQATNTAAQNTVTAYNDAIAAAEGAALAAQSANFGVFFFAFSLGTDEGLDGIVDPNDFLVLTNAISAAQAAAAAADLVVTALTNASLVPNAVLPADVLAAQIRATAANALVSDLIAIQNSLTPGEAVPPDVNAATVAAGLLAANNFNAAGALTGTLNDADSLGAATTAATTAASNLATEIIEQAAALATHNSAVTTSNSADAALANAQNLLASTLAANSIEIADNGTLVIPNVAPDEGISAPFNSWMTLFGQFFDHGLDLVNKGGNGTVIITLQPDDPLFNKGADGIAGTADDGPNFMALTRATVTGVSADGTPQHNNQTTPFVDQNQTYTSHASHQVFLREYAWSVASVAGGPKDSFAVSTGRLLDNATGTMATWADVKAKAQEYLGIQLVDEDVHNVPLLRTDEYGRFIPGPNGYAQIVLGVGADGIPNTADDVVMEGDPDANGGLGVPLIGPGNPPAYSAVRIAHAFLDDIAHNAAPGSVFDTDGNPATPGTSVVQADSDPDTGNAIATDYRGRKVAYDDELLDRHFITGDGRGNENIGLTTVHHVFHAEHNRQVEQIKKTVAAGGVEVLNKWLVVDVAAGTVIPTDPAALATFIESQVWDGERLFQAARFATEMQYQHLVFEEFGRKVNPMIDLFVFNPTMDINPAIFAEFAHVVYRFGHSMLTETVDRLDLTGNPVQLLDANGNPVVDDNGDPVYDQMTLVQAFLNPVAFDNSGVDANESAGAIVRGMTRQVGSEIDEFVVDALRNFLVGLPLDLPALNIARGRDTGIPSFNDTRAQLYAQSGQNQWLKPYASWAEFAQNLKTPASVINFIAAYGTHAAITTATTLAEKRDAATKLVLGDGTIADGTTIRGVTYTNADRLAFLNGTDGYTGGASALGKLGGLNNVDLWIGGLAEAILPFGGMLGSTFTAIFEKQMENLQNGDRFYYLSRTQGLHFLTELESNSFAEIIKLNTDLGNPGSTHIPGEIFATPQLILEVNTLLQTDYNPDVTGDPSTLDDPSTTGVVENIDPSHDDEILQALQPKVDRQSNVVIDGTTYQNYLKFQGGEHVVLGGTELGDILIGDLGDDTIWGDGGDDYIVGGHGINRLHGGAGSDIMFGGGDPEFIHGEDGNDIIHGGNGIGDLIFGDAGNDFIVMGFDAKEAFAGEGNDFVLGTPDVDFILGGEGDDWLEGGEGFDTIAGANSQLFFNSDIKNDHDVMFAGTNEMDFDAESGDDIMVQGESVMRNEGMFGFDWVSYEEHKSFAADADLRIKIFTTVTADILRNRHDRVEAVSGSALNDSIVGDDRIAQGAVDPLEPVDPAAAGTLLDDELTKEGVERIAGLREVLASYADAASGYEAKASNAVIFDRGNILLGGDGSDVITGGGGDDIIDGDKWLNVRIGIVDANGIEIGTAEKMQGVVTMYDENSPLHGKTLDALVFQRAIDPGNLRIVREILNSNDDPNGMTIPVAGGGTHAGDFDTAVYAGNEADYSIDYSNYDFSDHTGTITVTHIAGAAGGGGGGVLDEGTDILRGIERIQFADNAIDLVGGLNNAPTGDASIRALLTPDPTGTVIVGAVSYSPIVQAGMPLKIATDADGSLFGVTDADIPGGGAIRNFTVQWQIETGIGTGVFVDVANSNPIPTIFTPPVFADPALALDGESVRAVISYRDGNGVLEVVTTAPTLPLAPASNLNATAFDDLLSGTHFIPSIPENQGFGIVIPAGGLSGSDIIDGLGGNDDIRGLSGDDALFGGALGDGNDILDAGLNSATGLRDIALFFGAPTDYFFSLTPDGILEVVSNDPFVPEEDAIIGVETVVFVELPPATVLSAAQKAELVDDLRALGSPADGATAVIPLAGGITANVTIRLVANILEGAVLIGTGADEVFDQVAGADFFTTDFGDLIDARGGIDLINAGAGNDIIGGGDGDDIIDTGGGDDIVSGGNSDIANDIRLRGGNETLLVGLNETGLDVVRNDAGTERISIGQIIVSNGGPTPPNVPIQPPTVTTEAAGAITTLSAVDNGVGDLLLTVNGKQVQIVDHFNDPVNNALELINFNGHSIDGVTIAAGDYNLVAAAAGVTALTGDANPALDADALFGTAAADNLSGGAGNDLLLGDAGNDTLNGGVGDDILIGGADIDTVSYAGATGSITVNLATGIASGADGNDQLSGIESVIGSDNADTITGSTASNVLMGGLGDDTYNIALAIGDDLDQIAEVGGNFDRLVIQAGGADLTTLSIRDSSNGSTAGDLVIELASGQSISISNHFAGGNNVVELINFDGATFAGYALGNADYVISIDDSSPVAGANDQNDLLTGDGAADTLNGNSGNDLLFGAGGNDTLNGGLGDDLLVGGEGIDTASYVSATGAVSVNLSTGVVSGADGNDRISGIENVTGGSFADSITGDDIANTLNGGAGNDIIDGAGGNDTINGGGGNDIITQTVTVNNGSVTSGRDLVNGGGNGVAGDRFILNGLANTAETFTISALTNGQNAGLAAALGTTFAATTEIVITRTASGVTTVIAELDNIEEITVNTLNVTANDGNGVPNSGTSGGDTVTINGDFSSTSLNFSTITVNGTGADIVDISGLQSDHRIVFNTDGSGGMLIGPDRPQDVVDATVTHVTPETGPRYDPADYFVREGNHHNNGLRGSHHDDMLIGHGGNDLMIGGRGDDVLIGGEGNDRMDGGRGNDAFVFAAGFGHDLIYNFGDHGSHQDVLDLVDLGITADDFHKHVEIEDIGAHTMITIDGHDSIILVGVHNSTTITQDDFLLK